MLTPSQQWHFAGDSPLCAFNALLPLVFFGLSRLFFEVRKKFISAGIIIIPYSKISYFTRISSFAKTFVGAVVKKGAKARVAEQKDY